MGFLIGTGGFLSESARTIRPFGKLFIYTRTRTQNERSVWGQHFPYFTEKENRILELDQLKSFIEKTPGLELEEVESFRYDRLASLDWLCEQARNYHYSTFALYEPQEFEAAMELFQANIRRVYPDPVNVTWEDGNILLIIRRHES